MLDSYKSAITSAVCQLYQGVEVTQLEILPTAAEKGSASPLTWDSLSMVLAMGV